MANWRAAKYGFEYVEIDPRFVNQYLGSIYDNGRVVEASAVNRQSFQTIASAVFGDMPHKLAIAQAKAFVEQHLAGFLAGDFD